MDASLKASKRRADDDISEMSDFEESKAVSKQEEKDAEQTQEEDS